MKKFLTASATLCLLTLTSPAYSAANSQLTSGAVGVAICSLYCSAIGPAGLVLMTSSAVSLVKALDSSQGKILANAILNDTQNFYINEEMSATLKQFVAERSQASELSENEIIDELNDFAVSLLEK